jgi:hypothetical protein
VELLPLHFKTNTSEDDKLEKSSFEKTLRLLEQAIAVATLTYTSDPVHFLFRTPTKKLIQRLQLKLLCSSYWVDRKIFKNKIGTSVNFVLALLRYEVFGGGGGK